MDLPLYTLEPVRRILDMFIRVFKSYDGNNEDDVENYKNVVLQESESLGVIPES